MDVTTHLIRIEIGIENPRIGMDSLEDYTLVLNQSSINLTPRLNWTGK